MALPLSATEGIRGENSLYCKLRSHNLPCIQESRPIIIGGLGIQEQCKTLFVPLSIQHKRRSAGNAE